MAVIRQNSRVATAVGSISHPKPAADMRECVLLLHGEGHLKNNGGSGRLLGEKQLS